MNVWVTRDEPPGGPLCSALEERGLTTIVEPVVTRRVTYDAEHELRALGPGDWLVLASAFTLQALAWDAVPDVRVAVVGAQTARAARQQGLCVEFTAERGGAEELFAWLKVRRTCGRVCYPRSSQAVPPEPWAGVTLDCPVVYETAPRSFDRGVLAWTDLVSVTSASAVRAISRCDKPFASIGPTTSRALKELGIQPRVEAPRPSLEALAQAIADYAGRSRNQRA